jgi:triphosphatase
MTGSSVEAERATFTRCRSTTGNTEVELKLEADPAGIDVLAHASILGAVDVVEHKQTSTYFDTPEQDLRKAGLSLRIRQIGTRRIQTVKAESRAMAGFFARPEWEMAIRQNQPVIDDHYMPLRTLVPGLQLEELSAIFRIVVTRQKRSIMQDEARIELVFDRGEIQAGGAITPINEVELELKAGSPAALFALARTLGRLAPLQLTTFSKAQRGYNLLARDNNPPVKSPPILLNFDMTSSEGFQAIAYACLHHFRLNQSILLRDNNPEALHQVRVALRRLRSALSIFHDMLADNRFDHIFSELRWIASELDMARDIDVLLASILNEGAREKLQVARAQAYAGATAALTSPRLRMFTLDLIEWITIGKWLTAPVDRPRIDRPLHAFAANVLVRCRRSVKRRGRHWSRLDDKARHRLRIKAKKLRYSADFFGLLFPGKKARRRRKSFLPALESLQSLLGDLNDRTTGAALLAKLGISDTIEHKTSRKAMLEDAAEAYKALIDVKQFWR